MEDNYIIDAFYYGNYQSAIEKSGSNPDYKAIKRSFIELQQKLTANMSEDDKKDFEALLHKQYKGEEILEADAFLYGFRLALNLMIAAL